MKRWAWAYGAALLTLLVLDGLWLGLVAKDFYFSTLGPVMADPVRIAPALLFYLGYPAGVVALVLSPLPATRRAALRRAALVGLVAYGTYDLTNWSTLQAYTPALAVLDMAWGTFITAVCGAAAYTAWQRACAERAA